MLSGSAIADAGMSYTTCTSAEQRHRRLGVLLTLRHPSHCSLVLETLPQHQDFRQTDVKYKRLKQVGEPHLRLVRVQSVRASAKLETGNIGPAEAGWKPNARAGADQNALKSATGGAAAAQPLPAAAAACRGSADQPHCFAGAGLDTIQSATHGARLDRLCFDLHVHVPSPNVSACYQGTNAWLVSWSEQRTRLCINCANICFAGPVGGDAAGSSGIRPSGTNSPVQMDLHSSPQGSAQSSAQQNLLPFDPRDLVRARSSGNGSTGLLPAASAATLQRHALLPAADQRRRPQQRAELQPRPLYPSFDSTPLAQIDYQFEDGAPTAPPVPRLAQAQV